MLNEFKPKMKNKKVKFSSILLLGIMLTGGLKAQSRLYIKEKTGTQTSIVLNSIKKLTFNTDNVIINCTDVNERIYSLDDIRYVNFVNFSTNVIQNISKGSNEILLYSNPVNDQLQINYKLINAGKVQVEIINLQGKILHQQIINGQSGINHFTISVSQQPKGLYIFRLLYSNKLEIIKFIKN
jgi:hypothetical protein